VYLNLQQESKDCKDGQQSRDNGSSSSNGSLNKDSVFREDVDVLGDRDQDFVFSSQKGQGTNLSGVHGPNSVHFDSESQVCLSLGHSVSNDSGGDTVGPFPFVFEARENRDNNSQFVRVSVGAVSALNGVGESRNSDSSSPRVLISKVVFVSGIDGELGLSSKGVSGNTPGGSGRASRSSSNGSGDKAKVNFNGFSSRKTSGVKRHSNIIFASVAIGANNSVAVGTIVGHENGGGGNENNLVSIGLGDINSRDHSDQGKEAKHSSSSHF